MTVTFKRAGSLAILAAGSASGAAGAQTFTEIFDYALDVRQPVNGARVALSQSYALQIGTALGQTSAQYTFANQFSPAMGPFPAAEGAVLSGNNGATVTSTDPFKNITSNTSSRSYGPSLFSNGPFGPQATPLQFTIGGTAYNGTANFIYDGAGQVFTLTTVDYMSAVAVAAVPEPAAWLSMIAGFGVAGGALRARRRSRRGRTQSEALAA
ncbi:MAG: PEPxxWA-CTERM sorting domain-containing protein [Pseudomonadota bacterium]